MHRVYKKIKPKTRFSDLHVKPRIASAARATSRRVLEPPDTASYKPIARLSRRLRLLTADRPLGGRWHASCHREPLWPLRCPRLAFLRRKPFPSPILLAAILVPFHHLSGIHEDGIAPRSSCTVTRCTTAGFYVRACAEACPRFGSWCSRAAVELTRRVCGYWRRSAEVARSGPWKISNGLDVLKSGVSPTQIQRIRTRFGLDWTERRTKRRENKLYRMGLSEGRSQISFICKQ